MEIFKTLESYDYEEIVFCQDRESGLKAIICIHDTTLGPALGGLRYWEYKNEKDAITDAFRLARGMTYKNAAAGVDVGGAKAVLLKDPKRPKSEGQIRAFGKFVEGLNGRYITAEDVGTTEQDMDWIYTETDYVVGTSTKPGTSGNPSPVTAHGIFFGLKAAVKEAFGSDNLSGRSVVVQGTGNVGLLLVEKLISEGAKVYVADLNEESVGKAVEMGAVEVGIDEVYTMDVDIYAPCALGAVINDETTTKIKARVIAGSANNQLADIKHGDVLMERGIVYAPDFIINAGGVINVVDEMHGGYDLERAMRKVENIYYQVEKVFAIAKRDNISTALAANILAEERIKAVRNTKKIFVPHKNNILKGLQ
ncbi:Glu/Leu/Phe/Val family dehydrogenase [Anaerosphaera multitolerans]|uniref:Glu/Leu/Phe/Val dehydrogenase n=1 Tax=Anaerosphaera multitolerans TaxID=2487351 RepID=A0A437S6U2_9FIRM|nr:Glu/Leu/Phe/Val dehydrogenase [Anaerosphaera multitolerans]RVU54668.1 Glu/Leu/Phe/Val dehydrogenase [Anaerosphaera multitolerans]